nr:transglutaminase domain-containing protein [uncultured Blautia sp.]
MKIRKKWCKNGIVLFLLVFLTGCSVENLGVDKIKEAVQAHQKSEEPREQEITEEQAAFLYGYQTLSADEQKIYRQLVKGLEDFQEEISLSPVSEDGVEKIFNRVMIDHPEYFWTEGSFQYYMETWPDGSAADMKVMPNYLMEQEEAKQIQADIEAKAQEWLAGVSQETDTYEKIKYVYETLIRNVDYDANSANNQNIQSVFLEGRTVCMGYSKATQYLLNQMGIFCTLVTGTASDGTQQGDADTGHAWNLVKIGDEFYYVDTTWGNPGYSDAQNVGVDIFYSYLCCNEDTLAPTHRANDDLQLPTCRDDRYNYYKNKGCWYETYDRNQIYQVMLQNVSGEHHTTELRFASREAYEQAAEEMVQGNIMQEAVQNSSNLSPGQQVSWQIYYGGWDNLIVIVWN